MGVIYLHGIAYGKGSGGGGTTDYDELSNRPSINGVVLTGNQSADDLDLVDQESSLEPEQLNSLLDLI